MNSIVTGTADHQGLTLSCCHHLHPRRLFVPSSLFEISQFADMVHFDVLGGLAEFASVSQESFQEFIPFRPSRDRRWQINEVSVGLAMQRDTPETCDQWRLALALDFHLQADIFPLWGGDRGVILAYHLAHAAFVFTRQCFEQGHSHDAVEVPQPGDVLCQLVVLDKPSIFCLIPTDDTVVTVKHEFSSSSRFPSALVEHAFLLNDLCWNS